MQNLLTTIKEQENEFDRRINPGDYYADSKEYDLCADSDTLLKTYAWPESKYELDEEKVKYFLRSNTIKLLEEQTLVLEGMKLESLGGSSPFPYYHVGYEKALDELISEYREVIKGLRE